MAKPYETVRMTAYYIRGEKVACQVKVVRHIQDNSPACQRPRQRYVEKNTA
jgi:hypothetical protein